MHANGHRLLKDLVGATASLLWSRPTPALMWVLAWAGEGDDLLDPRPTPTSDSTSGPTLV